MSWPNVLLIQACPRADSSSSDMRPFLPVRKDLELVGGLSAGSMDTEWTLSLCRHYIIRLCNLEQHSLRISIQASLRGSKGKVSGLSYVPTDW